MEENPPEQSSRPQAGREVPHSRTPQAAFSTPEQSPPEAKPTRRSPRPSDAKAAPPVTFQPPPAEADDAPPRSPRKATPRSKSSPGTPPESTTPTKRSRPAKVKGPAESADAPAPVVKAPHAQATPRKAPARKTGLAARTEITPAKAFPQQTTGAKKAATPAKPQGESRSAPATRPDAQMQDAAAKLTELRGTSLRPRTPRQSAAAREVTGESVLGTSRRSSRTAGEPSTGTSKSTPTPDSTPAKITPAPEPPPPISAAEPDAVTPTGAPDTVPPIDEKGETPAAETPTEQPAAGVPAGTSIDEPDATTPVDELDAITPVDEPGAITPVDEPGTSVDEPGSGAAVDGPPGDGVPVGGATLGVVAGQVRRTANNVWDSISANPRRAPELLALTAVQAIGPRAAGWAHEVRVSYPGASADGVGRLAVRRFTRRSGLNAAIAAMTGGYAPLALWGVGAYHQAELVLHVAAAYGLDPVDPARAVELLVLTRMHLTPEGAAAAMEAAQVAGPEPTASGAAWRLGRTFAVHAGGWAVLRRILPGGAVVAAAVTSHAAMETLGARATTFYRAAQRGDQG